jgi:hypothetical protein
LTATAIVGPGPLKAAALAAQSPATLESFMGFSRQLVAEPKLRYSIGRRYLGRLLADSSSARLIIELLAEYDKIASQVSEINSQIESRIMASERLGPIAQQLIYLWYLSAIFVRHPGDPTNPQRGIWAYGSLEEYESALVWSVIDAHAPMTRGGPFGYWAEPPRNRKRLAKQRSP